MEQHLFYVPGAEGGECILPPDESRHCIRVLRMGVGDPVLLTNGSGGIFAGKIAMADDKRTLVTITGVLEVPARNFKTHIAIAPTKNINRFEWFLEKCTEIGVDEITPVFCENSERRVIKPDRLEKIIVAAGKQSRKAVFPRLNEAVKLDKFLDREFAGQKFMAYLGDQDPAGLKERYGPGKDALILIGPEGDFSPDEAVKAAGKGYELVHLGNERLRTETAGVVACHTIVLMNS